MSWEYLDPVKCNAPATAGTWNQPGSSWTQYTQITSLILRKINQIKKKLFSNKFENRVFYRRVQQLPRTAETEAYSGGGMGRVEQYSPLLEAAASTSVNSTVQLTAN